MALFVTTLIISNISATKLFNFFGTGLIMDGGAILFPLSYVLGDVATEIYGFRRTRRIIYIAFVMNIIAVAALAIVQILPPADVWPHQAAYETIIGFLPRIVIGSLVAFLVGQLLNSYVFEKVKARTQGKYLALRAILSSLVGDAVDTLIFTSIAFLGAVPTQDFLGMLLLAYAVKTIGQILLQPVTYLSVYLMRKVNGTAPIDTKLRLADVFRLKI